MELLYTLQNIRTPVGESVFMAITQLGSQKVFMACICALMWIGGRNIALRAALSFAASGFINHMVKIAAAIPRPWLLDERIIPAERALADATGYSFPSGHTQTLTSLMTTLDYNYKKRWLYILSAALIPLLMLSRMYLGVHTPWDVLAGFAVSFVITILINKALTRAEKSANYYKYIFYIATSGALIAVIYGLIKLALGTPVDKVKDMIEVSGAVIGFVLGLFIDSRRAEAKLPLKFSIPLTALGLGVVVVIQLLSGWISARVSVALLVEFISYLVTTLYITWLHPCIMRKFQR